MAQPNYDAGFDSLVYYRVNTSNGLSKWPMYYNEEITFSGRIFNYGLLNFDSVLVSLDVKDQTATTIYTSSVVLRGFDTITTGNYLPYRVGKFLATQKGVYRGICTITMYGQIDGNTSNNIDEKYFEITDDELARDNLNFQAIIDTVTGLNAPGQNGKMCQTYLLKKDDYISSVKIKLYQPTFGDSVKAFIMKFDTALNYPDTNNIIVYESNMYYIQAADTLGEVDITLNFPLNTKLTAGGYCIGIYEYDYSINIACSNRGWNAFRNFFYYDALGGWVRNEAFDAYFAYYIHPIFSCQMTSSSTVSTLPCNPNGAAISVAYQFNKGAVSFLWNNGNTTNTISGLANGVYTCTMTDSAGCQSIATVNVINALPAIDSIIATPSGFSSSNGTATPYVVSPNGIASYLWSNGSTNGQLAGVPAGTYTVTVTDANGCTTTGSVFIPLAASVQSLAQSNVIMYPVPASDYLMLSNLPAEGNHIVLLDVNGRIVRDIYVPASTPFIRLNVEDVATGIYAIKLTSKSNIYSGTLIIE
ncbi:MAG: T9SS type A sorting domain-containing protein [Bacteroidetes bacterium]|nr:T9SS type A sorting domain-containing protein [Bacteroidota bacterium]